LIPTTASQEFLPVTQFAASQVFLPATHLDQHGQALLQHLACEKASSPPVIQLILDDYPEAARLMASNGETALHVAHPRSEDT
jgi:hypothetical protein